MRVKLLPETAASASQQCELEKNDVTVLNAVSDDAFELFSLLLKDVVSQLRDGREESRLWAFRDRFIHRENYLCGYVFPLLASVSLLRLSFAQWTALADLLLVVITQLEMEAFHHPLTPAKEFLDCLALHFVLSPLRDDPVVCEDRFLQNGLRLSELPREDRFLEFDAGDQSAVAETPQRQGLLEALLLLLHLLLPPPLSRGLVTADKGFHGIESRNTRNSFPPPRWGAPTF